MGIFDEKGNEVVRFSSVWKYAGMIAFAMIATEFGLLITWGIWITATVNNHGEAIAVLRDRANRSGGSNVTQSVNVGEATAEDNQLATHRTYLTTADVAKREDISVREVTDMIAHGEITPPPAKDGREYRIAADYRILPQPADDCGNQPQ